VILFGGCKPARRALLLQPKPASEIAVSTDELSFEQSTSSSPLQRMK
jgi:hypothetical protein